jgi:ribosomal protein S18 acetylase RimI-like enzyme
MSSNPENQRIRYWMKIATRCIPDNRIFSYRQINSNDVQALGALMDRAYQGTIDHEGETLDQCVEEINAAVTGKYGPFIQEASFIVTSDNKIICASLVTLYKEKPLLAFSMTDPDFQRKGLATFLIEKSINALARTGYPEIYLVVTNGNLSAQNLYFRLGFCQIGRALPQQPPPN